MDAFNTLRKQAREKRDKTLAIARNEYAATLVRIATLEQDLNGHDPPAHKSIASCVESVMPSDRSFTTVDIMAGLEALDPRRVWRKRSVDSHIARLREKGLVIRLKRSQLRLPAVYAREGVEVEPSPFGDMTLKEVVAQVLDRPMSQTELVVAMLEAGYQTSMNPKKLRDAVGVVLREGTFSGKGGKWAGSLARHIQ